MNDQKFQIIRSSDLAHVERIVNDLIDKGWRINGNFYAFPTSNNEGTVIDITYIQAMILE